MTTLTLERDAASECYEDVVGLIRFTVNQFVQKYGGDFDELFSQANVLWAQRHREIINKSGKFHEVYHTEIRRCVWYNLFDQVRVERGWRRKVTCQSVGGGLEMIADTRHSFNVGEFLEGLSEDAATVAKLVLNPPTEVSAIAEDKGGEPRNWRSTVRAYLVGLGWATDRITESFSEVADAL